MSNTIPVYSCNKCGAEAVIDSGRAFHDTKHCWFCTHCERSSYATPEKQAAADKAWKEQLGKLSKDERQKFLKALKDKQERFKGLKSLNEDLNATAKDAYRKAMDKYYKKSKELKEQEKSATVDILKEFKMGGEVE